MEHGDRSTTHARAARRGLSLALLAVQLVVFTLGAALAGLGSHAHAGASGRALAMRTASSTDGAVRPVASSDARLDPIARPRGDRGERSGAAPPLDLALPLDVPTVGPASLEGSLAWLSFARDHRSPPSVVNGARGPPHTT